MIIFVFRIIVKLYNYWGFTVRYFRNIFLPVPNIGGGKFYCSDNLVIPKLSFHKNSFVELNGDVQFVSDLGESGRSSIRLGKNAKLTVNGDFRIGPRVTIIVSDDAELTLNGRRDSSASGITSDSRIMVSKDVKVGFDTIIAWNTFITDCDWHSILGCRHTIPTSLGDRVWVAHGSSVLKGSSILNDSILASHSVCMAGVFPSHSLLAGVPARIVKSDISWVRELF
jgi:hypothetical protein